MNNNAVFSQRIINTIPQLEFDKIKTAMVEEVGFGAGPAFMAQHTKKFELKPTLEIALNYLEKYKDIFKIARVKFENGYTLFIDRDSFVKLNKIAA